MADKLEDLGVSGMATPGKETVELTVEESSKETNKPPAEAQEQKDDGNEAGKDEVTPKTTNEAAAGDETKKKVERSSRSRTKSPSPEPELGKRSVQLINRLFCFSEILFKQVI